MKTKLLIFGISGDLSTRKLLPAISNILATDQFNDLEVIGVSRRELEPAELMKNVPDTGDLLARTSIFSMDLVSSEDYTRLKRYVDLNDDEQLLVYLSVPPAAATQITDFMGEAGFTTPNVKILFEKPFGVDLASAKEMIARTSKFYNEDQLYRIDHYLAKEMAQNIVALRGRNALFSHLWSNQFIESIEIMGSETIGIEGRAQFYEQTGALRDVLQGHLMQLLALTLMDIPEDLDWNQLPELRLQALQSITPADPAKTFRAQYEGYQEEVENPGSQTETFVSLELSSTDPRWQGVPLRLTTGKALAEKTTEIRIHLKKTHDAQSNCLIFRIQPNEGVQIELFVKKPGYAREFEAKTLEFTYPEDTILPDAYEQVIVDAIRSRKSLFTSNEEVLRSWEILTPVQQVWDMDSTALSVYTVGSTIDSVTTSG